MEGLAVRGGSECYERRCRGRQWVFAYKSAPFPIPRRNVQSGSCKKKKKKKKKATAAAQARASHTGLYRTTIRSTRCSGHCLVLRVAHRGGHKPEAVSSTPRARHCHANALSYSPSALPCIVPRLLMNISSASFPLK